MAARSNTPPPAPSPSLLRRPRGGGPPQSAFTPDLHSLLHGFSSDTPLFSGVSAPPTPALRDLFPGPAPSPSLDCDDSSLRRPASGLGIGGSGSGSGSSGSDGGGAPEASGNASGSGSDGGISGSGYSRAGAVAAMGALFHPGDVPTVPAGLAAVSAASTPALPPGLPCMSPSLGMGPAAIPPVAAVVPVHGMLAGGWWTGMPFPVGTAAAYGAFMSGAPLGVFGLPAGVGASEFGGSSLTSSPDLTFGMYGAGMVVRGTVAAGDDKEQQGDDANVKGEDLLVDGGQGDSGGEGDDEEDGDGDGRKMGSSTVPRSSKLRRQQAVDDAGCSASQAKLNRAAAVKRLRAKKRLRTEGRKVRYACRKKIAMVRPRINGRFATKEEVADAARLGITLQ